MTKLVVALFLAVVVVGCTGSESEPIDTMEITPAPEEQVAPGVSYCWITLNTCNPEIFRGGTHDCTCTAACSDTKCHNGCNSLYASNCQ